MQSHNRGKFRVANILVVKLISNLFQRDVKDVMSDIMWKRTDMDGNGTKTKNHPMQHTKRHPDPTT